MENMDIQIIKSRRRTVSIEVHTDGSVILRAPNRMTKKELDIFIDKHMSWIESKQQLMKERKEEKERMDSILITVFCLCLYSL